MNLASRFARKILPSRLALMGAATAATLGLVGIAALAGAAIPASDSTINGCYDKNSGNLRVIDIAKAACKNSETAISWNEAGAPGPVGPQGPVGPTGPQGPAGTGGGFASLDDLDGIDCTRFAGEPGVLAISHGEGSSILFDCNPISTCGDDTHGDLPSQAVNLPSVSGDDPNQAGPVSVTGIICPGDVDYFRVSITESSLVNSIDLTGLVNIQMVPGVPLNVTPTIIDASNEASATPLQSDTWTIDLGVEVTDGPAPDFVTLQLRVEGTTPAITGTYTINVYGAGGFAP